MNLNRLATDRALQAAPFALSTVQLATSPIEHRFPRDQRMYRAFIDFDEPEPLEEFDDDDLEDDDDDRNALTDDLGSK